MARPLKLTPAVADTIVKAISLGSSRTLACQGAGIDDSTVRYWLLRAQKDSTGPYASFAQRLSRAEASRVALWLGHIEEAAKQGSWQAAAWKLERLYPHLFSKAATEVPAMLQAILSKLPQEVALQVLEAAGVLNNGGIDSE